MADPPAIRLADPPAIRLADPAAIRLDVPEELERERLWWSLLPRRAPVEQVDLARLAREYELTGGYIKNITVRAAFMAAANGVSIRTSLLRHAATLELEDMGRLVAA